MRNIRFNKFETFEEAIMGLHDCEFNLDSAKYDAEKGAWSGKFFLADFENKDNIRTKRKLLIFKTYIYPTLEATVTIDNVTNVSVEDKAKIGCFTFNQVEKTDTGCTLFFNEAMAIALVYEGEISGEITYREMPDMNTYVTSLGILDFGYRTK